MLGFSELTPALTFACPTVETNLHAYNIIKVLIDLGRPEEAEPRARQLLATRQKTLGNDDRRTVNATRILASSLSDQTSAHTKKCGVFQTLSLEILSKMSESVRLYQEAFQADTRIHGPRHESTLTSQHNLGLTLYKAAELTIDPRQHVDGCTAIYTALALRIELLGESHPDTLASKRCLAFYSLF